jgi:glyoxylase-like metal-dependent hydrolase (beta-lactamase superfamily II)/Tfp pilus assembly protein PilF
MISSAAVLIALILAIGPLLGSEDGTLKEAWKSLASAEKSCLEGLKEFQAGRYESAAAAFQKCIQVMPRHCYAHYYLANIFYIQADYQRSLAHMEQSLRDYPFMQELNDYAVKRKAQSIDSYQRMLAAEWESEIQCRSQRELESLSDDLATKKSKLELEAAKLQEARAWQKAHYLYFLGNIYFQLRRFAEAAQKYREAIALNPRHALAYNNVAAISYLAGDFPGALDYLEKAEIQGLGDNLNLKLKFLVYQAIGRPTEGILEEHLSSGPESELSVVRFALAYAGKDDRLPVLYENCYVVFNRALRQGIIIDPGVPDPQIDEFIKKQDLKINALLITHGHEDHAGAAQHYARLLGAPVFAPRQDGKGLAFQPDKYAEDGETLRFDGLAVGIIQTPGHTPGSTCYLIGDFLFSGDTLFKNDIGKVWTENPAQVKEAKAGLIRNIKEKLLTLGGQTRVCPGHGQVSTIAEEKANNPFLTK